MPLTGRGTRRGCVNLGRRVTYDGGAGVARDVDEEGALIVDGENGEVHVFTGEVSVAGHLRRGVSLLFLLCKEGTEEIPIKNAWEGNTLPGIFR